MSTPYNNEDPHKDPHKDRFNILRVDHTVEIELNSILASLIVKKLTTQYYFFPVLSTRGSRSQSQASAFDESTLNMSQFVQLTETFLGDEPNMEGFNQLVRFVREGYMETEEERMSRLIKVRTKL